MELRRAGITEPRLLNAIEATPRQLFVPESFADQAVHDIALPIGCGQTTSQPLLVARVLQALAIEKTHKVLEIGTGSGWQTAVLSHLCRRVYSLDIHRPLQRAAEHTWASLARHNITTQCADGAAGWAEQAPFDRIVVSAAAAAVPEALMVQLSRSGLLAMPVGEATDEQRMLLIDKAGLYQDLGPVRFVPLTSPLLVSSLLDGAAQ
jgi:protein-L-isoaspartate(D-aspartate) O-methyltransferase